MPITGLLSYYFLGLATVEPHYLSVPNTVQAAKHGHQKLPGDSVPLTVFREIVIAQYTKPVLCISTPIYFLTYIMLPASDT